ncbi:MAG: hypothetical protein ACI8XM_002669 [Haloarculaceae archaeon]|jgi:hypothetical protein
MAISATVAVCGVASGGGGAVDSLSDSSNPGEQSGYPDCCTSLPEWPHGCMVILVDGSRDRYSPSHGDGEFYQQFRRPVYTGTQLQQSGSDTDPVSVGVWVLGVVRVVATGEANHERRARRRGLDQIDLALVGSDDGVDDVESGAFLHGREQ